MSSENQERRLRSTDDPQIFENVRRILEENEIFNLSPEQSASLARNVEWVIIEGGEDLFREGDSSDAFYLLISGRMDAVLKRPGGAEERIGTIHSGETIGEMGLVPGYPRSCTVRARRVSTLLRFERDFFLNLPQAALFQIIDLLIQRSRDALHYHQYGEPQPEHIAIVPMTTDVVVGDVAKEFVRHWPADMSCQTLSAAELHASKEMVRTNLNGSGSVFLTPLSWTERGARLVCEEADRTIFVATANRPDLIDPQAMEMLAWLDERHSPIDLLLLHSDTIQGAGIFLEKAKRARFYHAGPGLPGSFDRVARILSGRAFGVALSGGGVRGWAHIGAFKALHEWGITVDAIVGTSAGAVLGSLWEISEDTEDLTRRFQRLLDIAGYQLDLRNFTFPVVSILDGQAWLRALKASLGDALIEDFSVPFQCVSCNIVANSPAIHTSGPAWKWVRASTSLPGLFPPVPDGDALYVDGAVIENLPVEILRRYLGRDSRILAVDLTDSLDTTPYYSPMALKRFEALSLERRSRQVGKAVPRLGDTLLRSLMMGSSAKVKADAELADIYVQPDVGKCGLLTTDQGHELIEAGYRATKAALKKFHAEGVS